MTPVSKPSSLPYKHFAALDLRVGVVQHASVVEGADKLLHLTVDFGPLGERSVVSGIRGTFPDPSLLEGRRFAFVVNLEPRTIRGIESQAMILAAHHEPTNTIEPLEVHANLPPGTPIN